METLSKERVWDSYPYSHTSIWCDVADTT